MGTPVPKIKIKDEKDLYNLIRASLGNAGPAEMYQPPNPPYKNFPHKELLLEGKTKEWLDKIAEDLTTITSYNLARKN